MAKGGEGRRRKEERDGVNNRFLNIKKKKVVNKNDH
jgi:hypothetical protein